MRRPNGKPVVSEIAQSIISGASITPTGDQKTTSRAVDYSFGLRLPEEPHNSVKRAFTKLVDREHSLNQSLAYISDNPLFCDLELKKKTAAKDPEVQLAIWMSSGLQKRIYHGWDTSIPFIGLVVHGHQWFYYLAYHKDDGLV